MVLDYARATPPLDFEVVGSKRACLCELLLLDRFVDGVHWLHSHQALICLSEPAKVVLALLISRLLWTPQEISMLRLWLQYLLGGFWRIS